MFKKILVYGATGSQGNPTAKLLAQRGYETFAVSNSNSESQLFGNLNIKLLKANLEDRKRIFEITKGIDAISLLIPFFLENPTDGLTYAINTIDAAKEANVKFIVWNSSGFILPVKVGNPAVDVRIDIANYLKASGIPFVIIQPSVYAENLLGPWNAPFVANKNLAAYPTPKEMRIGWIATEDVSKLTIAALERPELNGSEFQVSGLENLDGNDLADRFSKALNRKIDYYEMPPSEFGNILDGIFGEGSSKSAVEFYQSLHNSNQYPQMFVDMDTVLAKLQVKIRSLQEWIKENEVHFTK